MNRRYNYSRLTPNTVERYQCAQSLSINQGLCSDLGPGLSPGIPPSLLQPQPLRTETITLPLYVDVETTDNKEEPLPITADKLKPSSGCCGRL